MGFDAPARPVLIAALLASVPAAHAQAQRSEPSTPAIEAPRFDVPSQPGAQPAVAPRAPATLRIERAMESAAAPEAATGADKAGAPREPRAVAPSAPTSGAPAGLTSANGGQARGVAQHASPAAKRLALSESQARVLAVRMWPAQEYTRVAIETTHPVQHSFFSLRNPDRLVLDLHMVEHAAALADLPAKLGAQDPHIQTIRVARNRPGVMRVVFELKTAVDANVFPVRPVGVYAHRLVIDIVPAQPADPVMALVQPTPALAPAVAAPQAAAGDRSVPDRVGDDSAVGRVGEPSATLALIPDANPSPVPNVPLVQAAKAPSGAAATKPAGEVVKAEAAKAPAEAAPEVARLSVVAIDAGHGGEDPGALGRSGTREKHVTLAIARRIKAELETDPNMRVVLTRDGDYFVSLAQRVAKARAARADVFVSIHADAFVHPDAQGSSVFALSQRGASSAAARWLARQENQADLVGGVNLRRRDPNLARTLLDLSQTVTINDSLRLGRAVLREIGGINRLHKPRVEQAGFAVLKAPDIPSILVETAFISNPAEERRLADADYQERMAKVIVHGIRKYLADNPPAPRDKVTRFDKSRDNLAQITPSRDQPARDQAAQHAGKSAIASRRPLLALRD